jgi:hypothetical protein
MKADTFAKLVVLEALIEAEIGFYLEHRPASRELFREGMVSRISDLIDEVDTLDSVAAARVYDAVVDFLAELPDEEEGIVEATIRFRRAIDRIVRRGLERRDLAVPSTWAIVLDELLAALADEYHRAVGPDGGVRTREFARVEVLLSRCRQACERMAWEANVAGADISDELDRLTFAVRHRRLKPTAVDLVIRSLHRRSARFRPSTLTRIGGFVVRQLFGRDPQRRRVEKRPRRDARGEPGDGRRSG